MQAFKNFVIDEWYFAAPLFLMSLIAVTLVMWRILLNLSINTDMNEFLPAFQKKLETEGIDGALRFCRSRKDLIPRKLYVAGLESSRQGMAAVKRAMANVIELEIMSELIFLLAPILAIAKIATMVGLLFTVISMIQTFSAIGGGGPGGAPTQHAGAIGLALFATAIGLVTAIPLVFAHVLFKDWISKFEIKMKAAGQKLIILLQSHKGGGKSKTTPV